MKRVWVPEEIGLPERAVDHLVDQHGEQRSHLLPYLHALQRKYRWLPPESLERLGARMGIDSDDLLGVAEFYPAFRLTPVGAHIVKVCHGTACHVKGSQLIEDSIRRGLGLEAGQDTDKDMTFTLQRVACLGCCTLAPVVQIENVTYAHLQADRAAQVLDDYLRAVRSAPKSRAQGRKWASANGLVEFRVTVDSCCAAGGTTGVREVLEDEIRRSGRQAVVVQSSCHGACHKVPVVEVCRSGAQVASYEKVTEGLARTLVSSHAKPSGMRWLQSAWESAVNLAVGQPEWTDFNRTIGQARDPRLCAFLRPQRRMAMETGGSFDPLDLDAYLARGGFEALALDPDEILNQVVESGLRGRGGAGFPTGRKWMLTRNATADHKLVVCNGDEGDPGAFMDRMLLESFPYRVIEGMLASCKAVGAKHGVFYIRAEYPYAIERIESALEKVEQRGLLGDIELTLFEGAGAFVCGEETALIASLEGRKGIPRKRPPYPAEKGAFGWPTLVNNVETLALIAWLLKNGVERFTKVGTERTPGTKVFALAGAVQRGGLIEVPVGTTIRQVVEDIGGGPPPGRRFKAVQIGGPSGGCIPAELADAPIDFETLNELGAIMGSGGLVVLDDRTCMVEVARYFVEFTSRETCGQCGGCRNGSKELLDLLTKFTKGLAVQDDFDRLTQVCGVMLRGSMCGLGRTAPNPVLSTLRYFRDEYEAHLRGVCPAKQCTALIRYEVTPDCIGCTLCAQACPVDAIPMIPHERHHIDTALCTRCDACRPVCPKEAIVVRTP